MGIEGFVAYVRLTTQRLSIHSNKSDDKFRKLLQVSQQNNHSQMSFVRCIWENPLLRSCLRKVNEKFSVLSELFAIQCNVIAIQRVRRSSQIISLYRKLYGDRTLLRALNRLKNSLLANSRDRPLFVLFGAALFSWEKEKVTDTELKSIIDDMIQIQHIEKDQNHQDTAGYLQSWEEIVYLDHLKIWRRPLPNSSVFEYKVYGTYYDIPANVFFQIQVDLDYRKQWDNYLVKVDVIDKDPESKSEVVHWVTNFPCTLYSREYLYVRKYKMDKKKNVLAMVSRGVNHPAYPDDGSYVRVNVYESNMVIKPHTSPDENGFDYVMTYYDDPQLVYSGLAYRWATSIGIDFVDKIHKAAKELYQKDGKVSGLSTNNNNTQPQNGSYSTVNQYC